MKRAFLLLAMLMTEVAAAASFAIVNQDAAGTGLNDTTPFSPVGGNTATTLGQARLNVIAEAGRIWGLRFNSAQTVVVEAQMKADTCTTTSATLASAGPVTFFTTSSAPNVLVPAALADAMNGANINNRNDIRLSINSNVGNGSGCLNGRSFYLGLDHNPGGNVDLLNVLLHEFAHGLGFVSITDSAGVTPVAGKFTSYEQRVFSEATGKFWPEMTDGERAAASTASGVLVYNGPAVNVQLSAYTLSTGLSAGGHLRLYAPSTYNSGASVSHWDTVANPNLLMEPFVTSNPLGLTDLTGCVMLDMGWPSARCPDNSAANTPPVAQSQTVSAIEDTALSITLRGIDADSGLLTYSIVSAPTRGALSPPASLTSTSGVTYVYTPGSNFNGTDSFAFQVSDGQTSSTPATVTINVAAVNDAPVATAQSVTVQTGQSLPINLLGSDAEGSALSYAVLVNPSNGVLSGAAPALTYMPNGGFIGTDTLQFQVNDGMLSSAPATVTITVTPVTVAATSGGGGGGGGGGSIDPQLLVLLAGLFWLARVRINRH